MTYDELVPGPVPDEPPESTGGGRAIDFQTAQPGSFDLDDVAVGETIAEFLVVALRNARLFSEARRQGE